MTDADIFTWAVAQRRWLLTENVKDFRPLLLRALQAGAPLRLDSCSPAAA